MTEQAPTPLQIQRKLSALRRRVFEDSEYAHRIEELRVFQNNRLEKTHQELLRNFETATAARFFLEQLYATTPATHRDTQVERVLPKLQKLLPAGAVEVLRKVILMDYLAEWMDSDLTNHINWLDWDSNKKPKEVLYIQAFRSQNRFEVRHQQVVLVEEVGIAIEHMLKIPFLRGMLRMTRGAAQKANLEDFHDFLSQGVEAFTALPEPRRFFQAICTKEAAIMAGIQNGTLDTFG